MDAETQAGIEAIVRHALAEDLGDGDASARLVPAERRARAGIVCREEAVLCGQAWAEAVYRLVEPAVRLDWKFHDGQRVPAGGLICELEGPARGLLSGERSALNFLQTLSATATITARYVQAVAGTRARILDTRKTLPGLRRAQKYAVRTGGGHNHRMGLFDAILIKENHILAAGSLRAAVAAALAQQLPVEIEVENLAETREALTAGAPRLLLDNFVHADLRTAVALRDELAPQALLEASGGVTLESVHAIAETGVDYISVGALTKDVQAVDLSMRFVLED